MATIEIPAGRTHWMRRAGLRLLKEDSASTAREAAKLDEKLGGEAFMARHEAGERKPLDWLVSDLEGCTRFLASLLPVVAQLNEGKDSITGSPEVLGILVHGLSTDVLAAELKCMDYPSVGGGAELRAVLEALEWSTTEAQRLVALDVQQREEDRKDGES